MFRQADLVSFVHANHIYPGQVSGYYPSSRTVYVFCIAPGSKHHGKEYIRFQDEVQLIGTAEDFLLLGIDRRTKLPYAIHDTKQLAELDRVEKVAGETDFEALQAARVEKFWKSQVEEKKRFESQQRKERLRDMILNRSEIPVSQRGKAGGLSVSIRENGQIAFSSESAKLFNGLTHCVIGWEEDGDRVMTFVPANPTKAPKGTKVEDWVKTLFTVSTSKNDMRYISMAGILKAVEYDYKASGTHSFPATVAEVKEGNKVVGQKLMFELPTEMTPKPKVPRNKKKKTDAPATNGTPAPSTGGTKELELVPLSN